MIADDSHVAEERAKYEYLYTNDSAYGGSKVRLKLIRDKTRRFGLMWQNQVMPQTESALDIGCGAGRVMAYMRKAGINCKGIDIAPSAIARLPEDLQAHAQVAEAVALPFPDQSFDLVYHFDGLEHIHPERIGACVEEHARVAKRFLAYTVPDALSNHDQVTEAESTQPDSPTGGHGYLHLTVMPLDEWRGWFEAAAERLGFELRVADATSKYHKVRKCDVGQLAVLLVRK